MWLNAFEKKKFTFDHYFLCRSLFCDIIYPGCEKLESFRLENMHTEAKISALGYIERNNYKNKPVWQNCQF